MTRAERIYAALQAAFNPTQLQVKDDSHKHAGHAGARAEGETHYTVTMVSDAFSGLSRVERHRKVNAALRTEFSSGLHALAINAKSPGE